MVYGLFQPFIISVLEQFGPGPVWSYVWDRLIEIVRYIIYNRVMTLESYQNFVKIYPALRFLNANNFSNLNIYEDTCITLPSLELFHYLLKEASTQACAGPFLVHRTAKNLLKQLIDLCIISSQNSKWVWWGNTTITNRRQTHSTKRKSQTTITRHQ